MERLRIGFGEAVDRVSEAPRQAWRELGDRSARLSRGLLVGRAYLRAAGPGTALRRLRIDARTGIHRLTSALVEPLPLVHRRELTRIDRQVSQLARELRELEG